MNIESLNILAVIVAAIAYFVLGALWFTPLFGKQYDMALGVKRDRKQKWPLIYYVGPFLSSLVTATALAALVSWLSIATLASAVWLGLIVGVGVALSVSCNNAINPVTPRPLLYGFVTGFYHVVGIILCSVIVTLM